MSFAPASVPRISATKLIKACLVLVAVHTLSSASTMISTGVLEVSLELGSIVSSSWATAFASRTTVTNLGNLFPVLSSDSTTSCLLILLAAGSQLSNLLSPGRSATRTPSDFIAEKVGHEAQLTKTTALVCLQAQHLRRRLAFPSQKLVPHFGVSSPPSSKATACDAHCGSNTQVTAWGDQVVVSVILEMVGPFSSRFVPDSPVQLRTPIVSAQPLKEIRGHPRVSPWHGVHFVVRSSDTDRSDLSIHIQWW
eukprot:170432-Amphidinium_carterae.4